MDENLSKEQMILETYLTMKQVEKRIERHGVEHREDMEKLWSAMKEAGKAHVDLSADHGERLIKLESERGLVGKAVGVVGGFIAGIAGGWLGKHS